MKDVQLPLQEGQETSGKWEVIQNACIAGKCLLLDCP